MVYSENANSATSKKFLSFGGDRGRGADLVSHHCFLTRFEVNPVYSHTHLFLYLSKGSSILPNGEILFHG